MARTARLEKKNLSYILIANKFGGSSIVNMFPMRFNRWNIMGHLYWDISFWIDGHDNEIRKKNRSVRNGDVLIRAVRMTPLVLIVWANYLMKHGTQYFRASSVCVTFNAAQMSVLTMYSNSLNLFCFYPKT